MSRALTVLDAGPLTTVQDGGRRGYAHLGVPRSGWLDAPAARLANRLVGNDAGAALAETTVGGVALRAEAALTVAVTGAEADVLVDGHGAAWGEPVSLPPGPCCAWARAPRRAQLRGGGRRGSTSRRCSGRGPPTGCPGSVRRHLADGRGAARRPGRRPHPSTYPGWPWPTGCSGSRPGRGRTG